MLGRRHKRFIASACAVLWMLSTTAGATQAVVCIGPEGHVALEPGVAAECADCTGHSDGAELSGASPCMDACGDCVDIPLPGQSEEAITPGKHQIDFKPVVTTLTEALNADQQVAVEHARDEAVSPAVHPIIRTTMLLL